MNKYFWNSFELDPEDVDSFTNHLKEKGINYHACLLYNKYLVEAMFESEEQEEEIQEWFEAYYIPLF